MLAVRVHEASTVHDLDEHADVWDALAAAAPALSPMLSHAWVAPFLQHNVQAPQGWRCLFAYAGDDLIGVLPVIRIVTPLPGTRLKAAFGAETRSGYALLAAGREREALAALLGHLSSVEPRYLWLRFCGIRDGAAILSAEQPVTVRVATMRAALHKGSATGSVLPVRGGFENYESGLGTNFRRNLRKARNRCERDHQASYRFIEGHEAGDPAVLQRFLDLEVTGWKGAAGTAVASNRHMVDFYTDASQRMSKRGWLEWHFLELDGALAAAHLAVRIGRSLVLVKIAYDEAYARLGPGNLLFRELAVRVFADEGVDEVNCLTTMQWHQNWAMPTVGYRDMVITRDRPLPRLSGLVEVQGIGLARRAQATPLGASALNRVKAVLAS
jgi:CelD/BcsL family acetyltransferase involved in cellulose biosynthesis